MVEPHDIVKGYQVDKNVYVQVEDEELEVTCKSKARTPSKSTSSFRQKISTRPTSIVRTALCRTTMWARTLAVIRDAMKGKGMVGLGRVVISKRERPIILEAYGKGIRAITLRYPYEVRNEDEYFADIPDVKISSEMLKLAEYIVETKTAEFAPAEFVDAPVACA